MQKITYFIAALLIMVVLPITAGCTATRQTAAPPPTVELNVSAALGLKDALLDIKTIYETQHPHVKLVYNLAAAGTLQKQIEQGAPADVFISAARQQVDALHGKHLIKPETRKNIVGNKLVIIVPKNSSLSITGFKDLAKPSIQLFGMGALETTPAGEYTRQVLTKLQCWDDVKGKAVLGKDIQTVLSYVETGNVDAGIVFSTVAITSDKVDIVAEAPLGSHEEIVFPGAVLSNTRYPQEAEIFLNYLTGPEAGQVFQKYGFTILK